VRNMQRIIKGVLERDVIRPLEESVLKRCISWFLEKIKST